jgi:hypothetical protein
MKTFAEYLKITLTGASGEEYVFEVDALGADLNPVGALYAVTRRQGTLATVPTVSTITINRNVSMITEPTVSASTVMRTRIHG